MHYMDSNKTAGKKLDSNCTRMLRAQDTPQDTNCTATCPPITKTIQVRQTKHAGHCWRSRDELISDVLLWTPTRDRAKSRMTSMKIH